MCRRSGFPFGFERRAVNPPSGKRRKITSLSCIPRCGQGFQGFAHAVFTILAEVLCRRIGDMPPHFHCFRKAVSVCHKDHLHASACFENALNEACRSEALVVRVRRKNHKTSVFRYKRLYGLRFFSGLRFFRPGAGRGKSNNGEHQHQ